MFGAFHKSTILIFTFTFTSLNRGVVAAPQMTSQPVSSIFLCSPLPSGTWRLQVCPFPHVVFPPLFLSDVSSVRCKMVLARPDERDLCLYHFSLRLFRMVGRTSCGRLPAGAWHRLHRWQRGLYMRCVISCWSASFRWLFFFVAALL